LTGHFSFNPPRTPGEIVYALLVAGMVSSMVLSLPLWITERAFPLLPLWSVVQPFPAPLDAIFLWTTVALLVLSVFLPANTWGPVGCCLLLALQDQVRWQPWFYQYLILIAVAAMVKDRNSPSFLLACRIFMICMYFWSGIHKLNPAYPHMYEATFTTPLTGVWPGWAVVAVRGAGPVSPWLETGIGLALCFRPTRILGVAGAVLTHLAILLMTGPLGTFKNAVVWPWNLIMPALVILLFRRTMDPGWRNLRGASQWLAAGSMVLLAGVMPFFSRQGDWDRYLSFQLYSGSERRLVVIADAAAQQAMPENWKPHLQKSAADPESRQLGILEWALDELGVPPPCDDRHLLSLARKCARMNFAQAGHVLFYTDFPFLLKERGWITLTPDEVLKLRSFPPLLHAEGGGDPTPE
jgi:hypothetical protein